MKTDQEDGYFRNFLSEYVNTCFRLLQITASTIMIAELYDSNAKPIDIFVSNLWACLPSLGTDSFLWCINTPASNELTTSEPGDWQKTKGESFSGLGAVPSNIATFLIILLKPMIFNEDTPQKLSLNEYLILNGLGIGLYAFISTICCLPLRNCRDTLKTYIPAPPYSLFNDGTPSADKSSTTANDKEIASAAPESTL